MKEIIPLKIIGEAGHSRPIEVGVILIKCEMCKKEDVICICIDTSEGEYGAGAICKDCITELFSEAERINNERRETKEKTN